MSNKCANFEFSTGDVTSDGQILSLSSSFNKRDLLGKKSQHH